MGLCAAGPVQAPSASPEGRAGKGVGLLGEEWAQGMEWGEEGASGGWAGRCGMPGIRGLKASPVAVERPPAGLGQAQL